MQSRLPKVVLEVRGGDLDKQLGAAATAAAADDPRSRQFAAFPQPWNMWFVSSFLVGSGKSSGAPFFVLRRTPGPRVNQPAFDHAIAEIAASTRVLIETVSDGKRWSTVGASTNIIEASWRALTDSVEYGLMLVNS